MFWDIISAIFVAMGTLIGIGLWFYVLGNPSRDIGTWNTFVLTALMLSAVHSAFEALKDAFSEISKK